MSDTHTVEVVDYWDEPQEMRKITVNGVVIAEGNEWDDCFEAENIIEAVLETQGLATKYKAKKYRWKG